MPHLQKIQTGSGGLFDLPFSGGRHFVLVVKQRPGPEVNHLPHCTAEFKNDWRYTSTPPLICLCDRNEENFTFSVLSRLIICVGIVCAVVQDLCAARLRISNRETDDSLFHSVLAQEILCSGKHQGTLNIMWGVYVSLVYICVKLQN